MIAKIIIDLNAKAIDRLFDYVVPEELEGSVDIGTAVRIPFGKGNTKRVGYVLDLVKTSDFPKSRLKEIEAVEDRIMTPLRRSIQVAKFIHEHYGSTMIQALKTVLPVKRVVKKGRRIDVTENRLPESRKDIVPDDEQMNIIRRIENDIGEGRALQYLLHGVTGSGKTQVFLELADRAVKRGKQVIVLIPEISLTYQMVRRFLDRFGDRIGVLHSRLTEGERYGQIERAMNGEIDIMIGPRSALFTPFEDPGLLIIDEEHEDSYKSDQSPKYDAREVAMYMSERYGIPLIAASATPSLESYYKAKGGIFTLLEMHGRRDGAVLPKTEVVDMREEMRDGNPGIFSQPLINAMIETLNAGEQVLLFINRRGHSNYVYCPQCGKSIHCNHCDVSYTYHRSTDELKCHYCGATERIPERCPYCGNPFLDKSGVGTQQVEEEVKKMFPDSEVLRLDMDVAGERHMQESILADFHAGKADILVGTQMIIKGHDFPGVRLVGMVNVDAQLNMSSYRAAEKTMQLLIQGAGRAGRRGRQGTAIFQTWQPNHYAVESAAAQDYQAFYNREILFRQMQNYPPVRRMLKITIADRNLKRLNALTERLAAYVEKLEKKGMLILGPAPETIFKLRDTYRNAIYIKGDDRIIHYAVRVVDYVMEKDELFSGLSVVYEIDPTF